MQIRKFSPFIQIPRTPLHHTPSARLMDATPLGVRGGGGGSIGEGNAGRIVRVPRKARGWLQTYDPIGKSSIRPTLSRDIHSLLYILLATFPVVVSTSVLYRSLTFALTIRKISIFRFVIPELTRETNKVREWNRPSIKL